MWMRVCKASARAAMFVCMGTIFYFSTMSVAFSQAPTRPSADFQLKLAALDGQFADIDRRVKAAVEKAKGQRKIAEQTIDDPQLDATIERYTEALKAAFDGALSDAKKAADAKAAQGNAGNLRAFEMLAQRHAARAQSLGRTVNDLQRRLASSDPDDMTKFAAALESMQDFGGQLYAGMKAAPSWIVQSLITPAEAAAAKPCLAPCGWATLQIGNSGAWAACLTCCSNAGGQVSAAWNTFKNCWNGAKKPKSVRAFPCFVKLVAVLA